MTSAVKDVREALETLNGSLTELSQQFAAAAQLNDPNLSEEGLTAQREQIRENARTKASKTAKAVLKEVSKIFEDTTNKADKHRPVLNPSDPAELAHTTQTWEHEILPQLQAGKRWENIIPNLTREQALAIERFAPSYLKAHGTTPAANEAQLNIIKEGIRHQHANLATTPEGAALIGSVAQLKQYKATAQHVHDTVQTARNTTQIASTQISLINAVATQH